MPPHAGPRQAGFGLTPEFRKRASAREKAVVMQASACSMRHAPWLPARPVQCRLLRASACTPSLHLMARHVAIPRVRKQPCVVLASRDPLDLQRVSGLASRYACVALRKSHCDLPGFGQSSSGCQVCGDGKRGRRALPVHNDLKRPWSVSRCMSSVRNWHLDSPAHRPVFGGAGPCLPNGRIHAAEPVVTHQHGALAAC